MGLVQHHSPVLLLMAAFSQHEAALDWACEKATAVWGPLAMRSDRFSFDETDYYQPTMGADLKKTFFVFERPIDPTELPQIKHQTNGWEDTYAQLGHSSQERPLNLDPGYLTEAKLVLATTKDRDHRVYLSQGIYAEVTLHYQRGQWHSRPWTYADYQREDYHQFFTQCRDYMRRR